MNIQEFSVRRGLVLGFTAAEIAVLLLFLLLLIMGILYHTTGESANEPIAEPTLGEGEELPQYEVLVVHYYETREELEMNRVQLAEQESKIRDYETEVKSNQNKIEALATDLEENAGLYERYQTFIKDQQNEMHALQNQVDDLNQEIEVMKRRNDQGEDEIEKLTTKSNEMEKQLQPLQQLQDENLQLRQSLETIEQQVQDLESQNQTVVSSKQELDYELERAQAVIERLRHELKALEDKVVLQSNEQGQVEKKYQASEYLVEQLEEELNNEKRNNERLQNLIDRLIAEKEEHRGAENSESNRIAELEQEIKKLEGSLAQESILGESESKGTNSACWYRMKSNADGSEEERALYLFDIQILDDSLLVYYPSKSRNGFSAEANFNREQLANIFDEIVGFDQSVIGKPLKFSEFRDVFQGFKTAGRNKKIREGQQCTFNVALWDHTSLTNKEGYQNAKEQVVDQIFSSYRYRDDPWPHG